MQFMFFTNIVEVCKYCSPAMIKYFNKEFVITKEDDGNFESYITCWICDNTLIKGDVK